MATLHILAGPNGAGKSTLYVAKVQPTIPSVEFVNADKLAAAHLGHHASTEEEAKKGQELAEERRATLMASGKSLVTESTFSHPSKIGLIQEAKNLGYKIAVYHVNVRSSEVSIDRVQSRVSRGGHDVPEDRIRGRYERNKELIKQAVLIADRGLVFDNSVNDREPELALRFDRGNLTYASNRVPSWVQELYADQLKNLTGDRLNSASVSFSQAKKITQQLLGSEAKTFIARDGSLYRGEIIGQTALHTLQKLGDQSVVAHFTSKLKTQPTMSSFAVIEYTQGQNKAIVQEKPARAAAFENQTEEQATKRFPELQVAYDIIRNFEKQGRAEGTITDANAEQFRSSLQSRIQSALNDGKLPKPLEHERSLGTKDMKDRER